MKKHFDDVVRAIQGTGLKDKELKALLRAVAGAAWPDLPPWSTLPGAVIEETEKASVGSGVVVTFMDGDDRRKVVLGLAGEHYGRTDKSYTIPGGFINLSYTNGSALVAKSAAPEDPRTGAAREVEEEFKNADGSPLLRIDPARLKPMDTKTIAFKNGEKRVVIGMMLELNAMEVNTVKAHIAKLDTDPAYRAVVARHTENEASGKPELAGVELFTLDEVADGRCNLLHTDQQSLFEIVKVHYDERENTPRSIPTRAYMDKVMTLDGLAKNAERWRKAGGVQIGFTSGVYDIVHPGHISFLEDARRRCGKLVVVIASDRTVRAQKGDDKPIISQEKRAQTIAAMENVDAVIISDEPYHETILTAIRPDIMFKGDDYKGMKLIGAELAGRVELIPCAEKEFYSSSALIRKIRLGEPG